MDSAWIPALLLWQGSEDVVSYCCQGRNRLYFKARRGLVIACKVSLAEMTGQGALSAKREGLWAMMQLAWSTCLPVVL